MLIPRAKSLLTLCFPWGEGKPRSPSEVPPTLTMAKGSSAVSGVDPHRHTSHVLSNQSAL